MPGPAMGSLLSVLGFASALSGFGAPWLSDRIGRKPVMIGFCLVGALTAFGAMYFQGSTVVLGALLFVGWLGTGTFPLFMGVIPGESMPRKYAATAMGLVACVGGNPRGFRSRCPGRRNCGSYPGIHRRLDDGRIWHDRLRVVFLLS